MNVEHHMKGLRVRHVQTPTGTIALLRPVAEKLLAEGVISGSLDGELHAADAMTVKAAVLAGRGVCDFCSAPGPSRDFDVPDFEMDDFSGIESTGGWAACDTCAALIDKDNRKGLLQRSIETAAFPKFTHGALKELHARFWKGMDQMVDVSATAKAIADTVNGTIPDDIDRQFPTRLPKIPRDIRKEAVKRELRFTDEEVELLMQGKVSSSMAKRMLAWKQAGKSALLPEFVKQRPPLADLTPHWQRAIETKLAAYETLKRMIDEAHPGVLGLDAASIKKMKRRRELVNMGFMDDVQWLHDAQAYSFNAETIAAIREAAQSIPADTALSEINFPHTGSGWFYFADPLPIPASPIANDTVHALLWGWESTVAYNVTLPDELIARLTETEMQEIAKLHASAERDDGVAVLYTPQTLAKLKAMLSRLGTTPEQLESWTTKVDADPALVFSAYVIDERGQYMKRGEISPSTRFYWRFSNSIEEMLERNGRSWDVSYGEGSEHAGEVGVMGRAETLRCVEQLARFFAMACVWFTQTVPVLTKEPGHVERHARKRIMHDHKLAEPPTVRVVALRKSLRVPSGEAPAERREGAREYHCRWIVKGHPRRQVCGPGRKDRKLIWIEAHPAGPDDKPLRTRETVYAVVR